MNIRRRRNEHNQVALTVIYFLGCVAALSALMSGILIHEAVVSDNAIDAAVVALIGQQVSITTLALGALGAMLSSTSPKPPPPPTVNTVSGSTPVTVVNPPEDPVETVLPDPVPVPDPSLAVDVPDGASLDEPSSAPPKRAPRKR